MTYPATSFGTIVEQYHYVTVNNTSGSQNTITINGTGYTLPANSGKVTLRHVEANTAWDRYTRLSTVLAQQVYEVWKEVLYYPDLTKSGAAYRGGAASKTGAASKSGAATKSGSAAKTGGIYATHTVDRFHAVVTATYSRCDQVISDFLQTWLGYTAGEIDSPSFSAAGSWYAANSYAFGFVLDRRISPVDFLMQLAFECRSTLKFIRGKWYLDVVPDAAPAAVRTISKDELAGEYAKFSFGHTPVSEIGNELVTRFKENYSAMGSESDWLGTAKASDAASNAKFGTYPQEFDFECIRSQAMADSVLAHILKQRKAPLLTVEFPVFYEHFDLLVGGLHLLIYRKKFRKTYGFLVQRSLSGHEVHVKEEVPPHSEMFQKVCNIPDVICCTPAHNGLDQGIEAEVPEDADAFDHLSEVVASGQRPMFPCIAPLERNADRQTLRSDSFQQLQDSGEASVCAYVDPYGQVLSSTNEFRHPWEEKWLPAHDVNLGNIVFRKDGQEPEGVPE